MQEPIAKLERPGEILALLDLELKSYLEADPKPIELVTRNASDVEGTFSFDLLCLQVTRRPPVRPGILVGEFAESVRISLDYLVWQLSLLTKPDSMHYPE
jgi:hypothetical protein